jgi:hypothetical protein
MIKRWQVRNSKSTYFVYAKRREQAIALFNRAFPDCVALYAEPAGFIDDMNKLHLSLGEIVEVIDNQYGGKTKTK